MDAMMKRSKRIIALFLAMLMIVTPVLQSAVYADAEPSKMKAFFKKVGYAGTAFTAINGAITFAGSIYDAVNCAMDAEEGEGAAQFFVGLMGKKEDQTLSGIESTVNEIDGKIDTITESIEAMDEKLNGITKSLNELHTKLGTGIDKITVTLYQNQLQMQDWTSTYSQIQTFYNEYGNVRTTLKILIKDLNGLAKNYDAFMEKISKHKNSKEIMDAVNALNVSCSNYDALTETQKAYLNTEFELDGKTYTVHKFIEDYTDYMCTKLSDIYHKFGAGYSVNMYTSLQNMGASILGEKWQNGKTGIGEVYYKLAVMGSENSDEVHLAYKNFVAEIQYDFLLTAYVCSLSLKSQIAYLVQNNGNINDISTLRSYLNSINELVERVLIYGDYEYQKCIQTYDFDGFVPADGFSYDDYIVYYANPTNKLNVLPDGQDQSVFVNRKSASANGSVQVSNENMYLAAGESKKMRIWYDGEEVQGNYTLSSTNDCVAVNPDGTIVGLRPGKATIRISDGTTTKDVGSVTVSLSYAKYNGNGMNTYHCYKNGTEKTFSILGAGYDYEYCTEISSLENGIDSSASKSAALADVVSFDGTSLNNYQVIFNHAFGKMMNDADGNMVFSQAHVGAVGLIREYHGKKTVTFVPIVNESGAFIESPKVSYQRSHQNDDKTIYIYTKEDLLDWKSKYDFAGQTPGVKKVNVVLMNDIDMEWAEWSGVEHALDTRSPSGYADTYSSDVTFEHEEYTFDGNGYAIKNITFVPTVSTMYYYNYTPIAPDTTRKSQKVVTYGMFSKLTGTVKNLTIENVKYADTTDSQLEDSWPRVYSVFASLAESEFQYMLDGTPGMQSFTLTSEIRNCVAKGTAQIDTARTIYYDPFGNLLDGSLRYNQTGPFTEQSTLVKNCIYDMHLEISAGAGSSISMFNYANHTSKDDICSNLFAGEITVNSIDSPNIEFASNLYNPATQTAAKSKLRVIEGSSFCGQDLSDYTLSKKEWFDESFWSELGWNKQGIGSMLHKDGYPTYPKEFTVDTSDIKGTYFIGDKFDSENLHVYGSDGERITDFDISFDGEKSTAGQKTVVVRAINENGNTYSASFFVTYVEHVPVTFTYDNQSHTRYAEKGGILYFPKALFTRNDGYVQSGWYLKGAESGTPIAFGSKGSISVASIYVPAWREGSICSVVFGSQTMQVREGTVITIPDYQGYDTNMYEAIGWYCKDAEPNILKPGDQLKVTKDLAFTVQTKEKFTTLRVHVLFQNVDDDGYTQVGTACFDQARHGEMVSAYYQDAFEQLMEPYVDEDFNWVKNHIVSATASNCLEDNSSGTLEYLVKADGDSTVTIKVNRPVYEVTWKNISGGTIETSRVRYGAMPTAPADEVCVPKGYIPVWDRTFTVVSGNTSYQIVAHNPSPYTEYTVNHFWQNVKDDAYTLQETESCKGTTGELTNVSAKTYKGMTANDVNQETIKGDGTTVVNVYYDRKVYSVSWDIEGIVTTESYRYGDTPSWKGETPVKAADVQYTYTFKDWGDIQTVTDNVVYKATFDCTLNKYGITWDIDGKTWTEYYDYGETPSYKGKTPEKKADAQYTYTFKDWGEITPVTGEKTYTANFDAALNKYTITWNVEGEKIGEVYEYGETPIYKGVNPMKLADVAYTYAFNGWGQLEPVTGDKTYKAQFVSTINKYTITWDVDGQQFTELYSYGETPSYKGVTPTKPATAQYSYTFAGWGDVTEVTGHKTYTANFEKSLNKYTITWNIDGKQTTEVYAYGDTPSYKGETPSRQADAQYTYVFRDWGHISKVEGDKTYTAVFDGKVNKYSITWIVDGKTFTEVYEYGDIPVYKGQTPVKDTDVANTYAFNGWGQIEPVTSDKAYTAVFVSTANKYTIIWDVDGVKQSELYSYGDIPSYKWMEPKKESDGKYIYTFTGWGEMTTVDGDKTYVANFDAVPVEYTITWDVDGEKTTETYKYGEMPVFKGETPVRVADAQYTYKFADWGEITKVDCDKTYAANFDGTLNQYVVTWNVDGVKVTETYLYGETPVYKGVTPTRERDATATYVFNGWGQMEPVTKDKTYTAEFVSTANKYMITWEIEEQSISEWYAYGETPSYKGVKPEKAGDAKYSYTFDGWGTIKEVTGNKTYKAEFDRTINEYTVTWNVDGKKTMEKYAYGELPSYKGDVPARASDQHYTYSFKDWGSIQAVTGDCMYTATFVETPIMEDLTNIAKCTLSYNKIVYDGLKKTPTVSVVDSRNNLLQQGRDYEVTYEDGCVNVGRYKVTVVFKGNYSGQVSTYFTIVPKAPKTATAKLYGYDDVKVSWSEAKDATGYYVYYKKSTTSKFILIRRTTLTSLKQADLIDGEKYTFKIVPYYATNGVRYVSDDEKLVHVDTLKKVEKPTIKKSGVKVKVKWKDIDGETGYQISKSLKKNGTNIVATKNAKFGAYKALKATKGKTYYYKVRAYKVVDGNKIFGPWSKPVAYKR